MRTPKSPDHIRGIDVGAGRQMRAVLFPRCPGQDDQRVLLELRGDLRLREIDEVATGSDMLSLRIQLSGFR